MKKYLLLFPIITLIWTCSENNPSQSQNSPPTINEITANPSQPKSGQVVTLNAIATDSDGDELTYNWSSSAGILSNSGVGNPINWTTPNFEGDFNIICIVSDGKEISTANISINVTFENGILSGYIMDVNTNLPIGQIRVFIADRADNSNALGYYEITNIPIGIQTILVTPDNRSVNHYNTIYDTIEIFAGNNELNFYLTD